MPLTGDTPRKSQSSLVSLDALYVCFRLLAPPAPLLLTAYLAASHCSDSGIHVPSFRLLLCLSLLQVGSCMRSQPHTHSHCPIGAEVACSREAHTPGLLLSVSLQREQPICADLLDAGVLWSLREEKVSRSCSSTLQRWVRLPSALCTKS